MQAAVILRKRCLQKLCRFTDIILQGSYILWEQGSAEMHEQVHGRTKVHLMIGELLRDSGCTTVLSEAQVLTSGRAQSALNEHHIKRTRYAHQVSLVSLCILNQKAYTVVMDHTNYARSLPVHVRDMAQLPDKHPDVYAECLRGNLAVLVS